MCEAGVQLHFFTYGNSVVPTPFVEETIVSLLNRPGTFIKNQLTIGILVYLWTLNSIPFVNKSILMPVSFSFNYCSFVVSFETHVKGFMVKFTFHCQALGSHRRPLSKRVALPLKRQDSGTHPQLYSSAALDLSIPSFHS